MVGEIDVQDARLKNLDGMMGAARHVVGVEDVGSAVRRTLKIHKGK
jgi:hypothetical protein|tara:strand:- start:2510 stop:2647 length:138 start_codon:yes stop_codon:yes gene_type:complete